MTVIRNKSPRPLRVPLSRGKVLHLGPLKEGQVSVHDLDHQPLLNLVDQGEIEILGEGAGPGTASVEGAVHVDTHGHHPHDTVKRRGNR